MNRQVAGSGAVFQPLGLLVVMGSFPIANEARSRRLGLAVVTAPQFPEIALKVGRRARASRTKSPVVIWPRRANRVSISLTHLSSSRSYSRAVSA